MHFVDQWIRAAHRREHRVLVARVAFWAVLVAVALTVAVFGGAMQEGGR